MTTRFLEALRYPHQRVSEAWVWRAGTQLLDEPLPVTGGTVDVDGGRGVRRTLKLPVSAVDRHGSVLEPKDVTDLLAPFGTELEVYSGIRYPEGDVELVPVGVFRIDDVGRSGLASGVELQGVDRSKGLQEARFLRPWNTPARVPVVEEIERMVRDANPSWEVFDLTNATDLTVAATWERDRDKAIGDLAQGLGAQAWFDPRGRLIIGDVLLAADPENSVWTIDAGPAGVLGDAATGLSREGVYNAVVATGQGEADTPPVMGIAMQRSGAFRWGGPYGKIPRFYSSPVLKTEQQCQKAAATLLAKSLAFARRVEPTSIANPALDADDVITVVLPGEGPVCRLVKSLSLPLAPDEPGMRISTRTPTDAELTSDVGTLD